MWVLNPQHRADLMAGRSVGDRWHPLVEGLCNIHSNGKEVVGSGHVYDQFVLTEKTQLEPLATTCSWTLNSSLRRATESLNH